MSKKIKGRKEKTRKLFLPQIKMIGQQIDEIKKDGQALSPAGANIDSSLAARDKILTTRPSGKEEAEMEDLEILPSFCLSDRSSVLAV